ncbi:hypothetical protein [Bacillus phage SBSphiJ7]|nr:hypothetical protein [Bacillus phage SBSphiJ7]
MRKTQHLPKKEQPEFTLTREQAETLKRLDESGSAMSDKITFLIGNLGFFKDVYKPLNNVPLDYLIKALVTREYHVEETFEDWLEEQANRKPDQFTTSRDGYVNALKEYKKRKAKGEL